MVSTAGAAPQHDIKITNQSQKRGFKVLKTGTGVLNKQCSLWNYSQQLWSCVSYWCPKLQEKNGAFYQGSGTRDTGLSTHSSLPFSSSCLWRIPLENVASFLLVEISAHQKNEVNPSPRMWPRPATYGIIKGWNGEGLHICPRTHKYTEGHWCYPLPMFEARSLLSECCSGLHFLAFWEQVRGFHVRGWTLTASLPSPAVEDQSFSAAYLL